MPGEFDLIRKYFTHRTRHTLLGVGDDAALLRVRRGYVQAVSADMLVEGRHFFKGADPEALGHKTLAVNLSDLAAMGAKPRWATLALALPRVDEQWIAAFARGFMRLAREHDVDLIGGDTTRGPLNLCVQIMGEVPAGKALRRDGARAGDEIWVSGTVGDAALAVAVRSNKITVKKQILKSISLRLDKPTPRVALGLVLRGIATSAIDISDGILGDLGHICERSGVGAMLYVDDLPVSRAFKPLCCKPDGDRLLLTGGDDYELCFTAPRSRHQAVLRASKRAGVAVTCVGRIVDHPKIPARGKQYLAEPLVRVFNVMGFPVQTKGLKGFDHFH